MAMFGLIGMVLLTGVVVGTVFGSRMESWLLDGELKRGECRIGRCTYLVQAVEFAPAEPDGVTAKYANAAKADHESQVTSHRPA